MWFYSVAFLTTDTILGYLPQDILNVIRQQFTSTDQKCIQTSVVGSAGGLGYLKLWINNQGTNVAGQIDAKTVTNWHNYAFFEIFY